MTITTNVTLSPGTLSTRVANALDFHRNGWNPGFIYNYGYELPPQWVIKNLLFQVFINDEFYLTVEYDEARLSKIAQAIETSYKYNGTFKDILSEIWNISLVTGGVSNIWEDIDIDATAVSVINSFGFTVISDGYHGVHYVFDNPLEQIERAFSQLDEEF